MCNCNDFNILIRSESVNYAVSLIDNLKQVNGGVFEFWH